MIESLRIAVSRIFAFVMLALILVSSSILDKEFPIASSLISFMGVALVGVCVLGRLWCSLYIAGYKTHRLIDKGPYSICRNPLYLFSLAGALAVGFATGTITIPAIILVAFGAYYPFVIKSEEARLLKIHGSDFLQYKSSVPRFFPNLAGLVEPKEYVVKPRIFRHHMSEVIWFILLLGFLIFVKELRRADYLPTLFHLY